MYSSHFTTCRRWASWSLAIPHRHYTVWGYDSNSLYNVTVVGDYAQ